MQVASRLNPEEFHILAEEPMYSVFNRFEVSERAFYAANEAPFRDTVAERFIVGHVDAFKLEEPLYRALCKAADAVGEHFMFYSVIRAMDRGLESNTWKLPLFDYESYEIPDYGPMSREDYRDTKGIALEQVVYSPRGEWGVLCDEDFALVGGSLKFVTYLRHELKFWEEGLVAFMEGFHEAQEKRGADVSWVQPLLDHLYREDAPRFDGQPPIQG